MGSLRSLFLKPVLSCTAGCLHCRPRLSAYRGFEGPQLRPERFIALMREARELGATALHLSGGEPTLYPELPRLVREGKRAGYFVILNTNGSARRRDLYDELLEEGLDAVILSIHAARATLHDEIKRRPGSFDEVVSSLERLSALKRDRYPRFLLSTQTIVTRMNFRELPEILDLVCRFQVDGHGISYVEGDDEGVLLPRRHEIEELRAVCIPAATSRLARHRYANPLFRYAAPRLLRRLYHVRGRTTDDLAQGRFADPRRRGSCHTPRVFAMILAEGSVLPCNMAEYGEGPVIGNVAASSLRSVIEGDAMRRFRREGMATCARCPSHLHFHIPLSLSAGALLRLAYRNPAAEQKGFWQRMAEAR
jgi:MoaA/NifB/PqqE/SkfB family radical SAM enzyme